MRHYPVFLMALLGVASVSSASAQTGYRMPPSVVVSPGPGGVRIADDGLVANWYPGANAEKRPAILLLGGSEGGIGPGAARQAADLVAHGFAVLHLAYFAAPGLPHNLDMVPLEYFDRALSWLRHQPNVDRRRLGIMGASKGAEAALLVASRNPDIRAIVAGAPSVAVWPGIDFTGGPTQSSWSLAGRPIDYLRYGDGATTMFGGYEAGLKTLDAHPAAAIPVARIKGNILLVCGRADTLWPSCPMSARIASLSAGRAEVLAYDDAGHAVFGPPVGPDAPGYASLGSLGGTAAGNDAARADAWPTILRFLATTLARR